MMRTRLLGGLATLALTVISARAADDGFISLFDGSSLSEWKIPEGDNGHWKVVNGAIDYDAKSESTAKNKNLVSKREFGDFVLKVDWRIKEATYMNKDIPYVLPDGTHARGVDGKELKLTLPDSDSGIYLRGSSKGQVNIWCWPIGSGEVYGYRMDKSMSPEVRAGVTPRSQADKPVGEWNSFEITMKGDRLTVVLNGKTVIENAELPGMPKRGPLEFQHHGGFSKDGRPLGPPSVVQFRNIQIKPLD
jgi:3-keto-disaccharide hydrolase